MAARCEGANAQSRIKTNCYINTALQEEINILVNNLMHVSGRVCVLLTIKTGGVFVLFVEK